MIRVAICDDDVSLTAKVEELLIFTSKQKNIIIEIETYSDGAELLEDMTKGEHFDIVFLDIEMKILNGLETAKEIRKIDSSLLLIFITIHESYAKDVFQVRTFDFIVKPFDKETFIKVITRAYNEVLKQDTFFVFKKNKMYYRVPVKDIVYFESAKRTIYLVTSTSSYEFYGKLNNIEKHLANAKVDFWRVHQSYLINSKYIWKIGYASVELTNGKVFSISEDRRKSISLRYCNALEGQLCKSS